MRKSDFVTLIVFAFGLSAVIALAQMGGGGGVSPGDPPFVADDLDDISTNGALPGQAWIFDGTNWLPGVVLQASPITNSSDLGDVSTNGALPGQAWIFDGTSWSPGVVLQASTITNASDLGDVATNGAVPGQAWIFDGTNWLPGNVMGASAVTGSVDLADVETNAATPGDAWLFDGTNWTPNTVIRDVSTSGAPIVVRSINFSSNLGFSVVGDTLEVFSLAPASIDDVGNVSTGGAVVGMALLYDLFSNWVAQVVLTQFVAGANLSSVQTGGTVFVDGLASVTGRGAFVSARAMPRDYNDRGFSIDVFTNVNGSSVFLILDEFIGGTTNIRMGTVKTPVPGAYNGNSSITIWHAGQSDTGTVVWAFRWRTNGLSSFTTITSPPFASEGNLTNLSVTVWSTNFPLDIAGKLFEWDLEYVNTNEGTTLPGNTLFGATDVEHFQ